MDSLLGQSWLVVISCLLYVGGVQCDCSETGIGIEGGYYTLTKKQQQRGSLLVYHCPEGHYPFPALNRQCLPSGKWSPDLDNNLAQTCKLVECPSPIVLMNGDVLPHQKSYVLGNETRYECSPGYTLKGSSKRICRNNGKWSGFTPICIQDSGFDNPCPDPGIPPGAIRTGNQFGLNDKVRYSCNNDMFVVGSKERMCMENGQWTGREPTCYFKHTYETLSDVLRIFPEAFKESLTNFQPTDDIEEAKKIKILVRGTINIYIAMDISERIEEEDFLSAKRTILELIIKISSYKMTPNFEIVFFSSQIYNVVNIRDIFEGHPYTNPKPLREAIREFKMEDLDIGGRDLNKVFEYFLEQMALLQIQVGEKSFEEHKHIVIVFTDGDSNMGGSPELVVRKIKNLVYLNNNPGRLSEDREKHLDIYIFGIGIYISDEYLRPLVAGKGGETEHYFRIKDISTLNEAFFESIDESEVFETCGLHRINRTDDKDNSRKMYPWFASVTIQNKNLRSCLGSLVTPRFVLTAAHCFHIIDRPEHVSVIINDGKNPVKQVETFMIHPNFDIAAGIASGVVEFYDYDVALIQLKTEVEISDMLRPICIPCTKLTRAAMRLDQSSTCKQQEELLLGGENERLVFLTKNEDDELDEVSQKVVLAKLRNNRNECIKHAIGAFGITTDNVTKAVTPNFLCTGGHYPAVDDIACEDDGGGAVFKEYYDHTIQVAVVSWGTMDICERGGMAKSEAISRDFHINLFKVIPFLKKYLGNENQYYIHLEFLD